MADTEVVEETHEETTEEVIEETIEETIEVEETEEEEEESRPGTSKKRKYKKTVKKKKTKKSPKKKKGGGGGGGGGGKSKKGGKGSRKGSIIWARRPLPEIPSFSPCPHIYFKRKEADRSKLKKAEYIDMLATPKREPWKDLVKTDDDLIPYRRRKLTARTNCLAIPKKLYVKAILEEFVNVLNDNQKDNLREILQTECDFTKENFPPFQDQPGPSKTTKSGGQDAGAKKKDQRAKSAGGGKSPASAGGRPKTVGSTPNKTDKIEQPPVEEGTEQLHADGDIKEDNVQEKVEQENAPVNEPDAEKTEKPQEEKVEDENFVDAT